MKRTCLLLAVVLLPVVLPGCGTVDERAAIAAAEAPRTPDVKDPIGKWEAFMGDKRFYRMTEEELIAWSGSGFGDTQEDERAAAKSYRNTSFSKRREIGLALVEVGLPRVRDSHETGYRVFQGADNRIAKQAGGFFSAHVTHPTGCACGGGEFDASVNAFCKYRDIFLLDGVVLDASIPREKRLEAVEVLDAFFGFGTPYASFDLGDKLQSGDWPSTRQFPRGKQ